MSSRYGSLEATLVGFEKSGVALVGFADGEFVASGYSDAKGIHYAIPWLVRTFGLSLDAAIDLFLYGVLLAGFVVGLVGLLTLFRTWRQRLIAVAEWALLLHFSVFGLLGLSIRDVYVFGVAATVAIVPWALVALDLGSSRRGAVALCAAAGLVVGAAHQFRGHACTGVGVLVVLLIWWRARFAVGWRMALTALMCGAALLPDAWFAAAARRRDAFLAEHNREYFTRSATAFGGAPWHSIYLGLSFLDNPHVPAYKDEVAIDLVRSIDPEAAYCTQAYSRILRNEVLGLARRHKYFVIQTVSAKAGVLMFWMLLFGNAGLLVALQRGAWDRRDLAFGGAALFAAAPGLLVMPLPHYVSSLLGLATIYGIVRLNDHRSRSQTAEVTLRTPHAAPVQSAAA